LLERLRLRFDALRFFRARWLDTLRRDGFGRCGRKPLRSGGGGCDRRRRRRLRCNRALGLWCWLHGLYRRHRQHWRHRLCLRLRNIGACFNRRLNRRRFCYRSIVGRHVGRCDVGCVRRLGLRIVGRFGTPESFEKAEHVLAY
jgi:hypothetical protein